MGNKFMNYIEVGWDWGVEGYNICLNTQSVKEPK